MTGIIVQARLGSSRLPNKMLLPFYDEKGILELLLDRIRSYLPEVPLVVATTLNPLDDRLCKLLLKKGLNVYRGSEDNVLDRFIGAAKEFDFDKIIRICADNPFLDLKALENQILGFNASDADYWTYCKSDFTPTILTHFGFWSEGVSLRALEMIEDATSEKQYIEHVTNYIYQNKKDFNICYNFIDREVESCQTLRLTIDTLSDFETAKLIYSSLIVSRIPVESSNVAIFVKAEKEWLSKMKEEIKLNSK